VKDTRKKDLDRHLERQHRKANRKARQELMSFEKALSKIFRDGKTFIR